MRGNLRRLRTWPHLRHGGARGQLHHPQWLCPLLRWEDLRQRPLWRQLRQLSPSLRVSLRWHLWAEPDLHAQLHGEAMRPRWLRGELRRLRTRADLCLEWLLRGGMPGQLRGQGLWGRWLRGKLRGVRSRRDVS